MFFFGTPEENAALLYYDAKQATGPFVPDVHVDEMTDKEITNACVYTRMAYRKAEEDGAPQEVLDVLIEWYDELFCLVAQTNAEFRAIFRRGGHQLLVQSVEAELKYRKLFEENALAD